MSTILLFLVFLIVIFPTPLFSICVPRNRIQSRFLLILVKLYDQCEDMFL